MPLYLKNPHSVLAILETRPQDIFEIRLPAANAGAAWEAVRTAAREIGVRLAEGASAPAGRSRREPHGPKTGGRRGGQTEAVVKERADVPVDVLFPDGETSGGLWLAMDTVQDPQNLGAIFRTAAFFGVRGILLSRDRSAPVSAVVYDVASGGVEYVPFSVQTNLSRALDFAKERGLWLLGASEHAETDLDRVEPDRPWLLVLGNEESGIRRLTRDKCDLLCRIPSRGPIPSLNVSVAAGILIQKLA